MSPSGRKTRHPKRIPAPHIPSEARARVWRDRPGERTRAGAAQPEDASTRAGSVLQALLRVLPARHRPKAYAYLVLTRMDRPVGALLLLWACWWALWLAAADFPPLSTLLIFTAGVFVMRAAGCAINDFADRDLDPKVQRTAGRPLAAGIIKPKEALLVFGVLLAVAFGLVLLTNRLTVQLSFGGAALAAIYPFTKRYTHLPQVVLGAAFGWSIPMAFAAVTGAVPQLAWLLFVANVLWSTIYDTEYAMIDRNDDIRAGAKSTAILFGALDRPIIAMLMGTFVISMALVGRRAELGWPYWVALAGAVGLFVWQQWRMRPRSRENCLSAFRNNNWVGLVLWAGIVLALALR